MSTAMDWLKTMAGMTPDEFDSHMDNEGINCTRAEPHSGTRTILGYPVTEEMRMDENLIAILGSGGSGGGTNTTNGNQLTWTWPTGAGNTVNQNLSTPPVATQTLYRRNTHDENGNPRSLNQAQEQAWTDSWPIGAMTSDVIWRTAEEIAQAANAYIQLARATGNIYYSPEAVSEILSGLVVYGVVELRTD